MTVQRSVETIQGSTPVQQDLSSSESVFRKLLHSQPGCIMALTPQTKSFTLVFVIWKMPLSRGNHSGNVVVLGIKLAAFLFRGGAIWAMEGWCGCVYSFHISRYNGFLSENNSSVFFNKNIFFVFCFEPPVRLIFTWHCMSTWWRTLNIFRSFRRKKGRSNPFFKRNIKSDARSLTDYVWIVGCVYKGWFSKRSFLHLNRFLTWVLT